MDHLTDDELEEAIRFGLDEERVAHLVACKGCQHQVEWQRAATLGTLWDGDRDWSPLKHLAMGVQRRGNGFVYSTNGRIAALIQLPFQQGQIIKVSDS